MLHSSFYLRLALPALLISGAVAFAQAHPSLAAAGCALGLTECAAETAER
jgi:hypothetical protein